MTTQPDRYFEFLSDMVGERDHQLLLSKLHSINFYSIVANDDNRGEDGKRLRDIFLDEMEGRPNAASFSVPKGPCTVLELLIGIAIRMENELMGNPRATTMPDYFWMLIKNLDLYRCNDSDYFRRFDGEVIDEVIEIFLSRRYERDGTGGLFPLRSRRQDQRAIEIWYQMMVWLMENFEF